jgi:hypothetical protein
MIATFVILLRKEKRKAKYFTTKGVLSANHGRCEQYMRTVKVKQSVPTEDYKSLYVQLPFQ